MAKAQFALCMCDCVQLATSVVYVRMYVESVRVCVCACMGVSAFVHACMNEDK